MIGLKAQLSELKIYKDRSGKEWGYFSSDVDAFMRKYEIFDRWVKNSQGQTCLLVGKRIVIYKWDVERFLDGLYV